MYDGLFFGEDLFFQVFPILFTIMFLFIFGFIGTVIIKGICAWNKNNHSPVLDVHATVVAKRTNVSSTANSNHMASHARTYYYATFQVESGDRMEFQISGNEYGMLVEGDSGKLTFQGTRYLGFER